MSPRSPPARTGRWYARWDRGELFQVTDLDEAAGVVTIRGFDGQIETVEASAWRILPLGATEPPRGWPTRSCGPARKSARVIWTEPTIG